ncbi:MAG: beta-N-acetylhexosaminidase [Clostridia bacterium]|nr:beta-N-acetylhexosaminidase [Clostridia bacterium]
MEIKELSIPEKVGQMIMVGMDTNHITERIKLMITKYKIGGIILYRKNFNTYQEMLALIRQLKQLNQENKIPLWIAIDQEGGRVNRMPKEILNLPAANKIANKGGIEEVKKSAKIIGEILKKSGYHINFAPVLDIKRFKNNHAIGDRCYGENKEEVTKYGIAVMKELQEEGILPVIKHFPGHGATKQDSHYLLPIIKQKIEFLEKEDMYPFEQAIKNGAEAILVGHLLIKNITGIYPASLSKHFIGKYVRMKYRYNGLIMTDDLKMKAIRFLYGAEFAVKKAFEAGNDIVVFRFNKEEEQQVIEKIIRQVGNGKLKEGRINRSVKRILKMKEKYEVLDGTEIEGVDIDKINNEIKRIRNLCGME